MPGLKLETNKLWGADAPAHGHRPFPPIALLPAGTCGPLPSGSPESGQASSSSPQASLQLEGLWRRGTRRPPPGRAQSTSDYISVTSHNFCFLDPKQGCSAEPGSHPSPLLPSLQSKELLCTRNAHGFTQLLPQARQALGLSMSCSFPALNSQLCSRGLRRRPQWKKREKKKKNAFRAETSGGDKQNFRRTALRRAYILK